MISEKEYRNRRVKLAKSLKNNSITLLYSATYQQRSNDTEYPFRQNSNFYYLSGFKEDKSILIIIKKDKKIKTILFVEKKDVVAELWNGKRLGKKEAKKRFLVDKVYLNSDFDIVLAKHIVGCSKLYYDFTRDFPVSEILKTYTKNLYSVKNIAKYIATMRLIKSDAEIEVIKKAISITKDAHHKAMCFDKNEAYEYQLQAEMEYVFKKNGAYSDAYTSIVASGDNANTLHYIKNNQKFKKDELILIDAGCEYDYYASDITRTIPTSKRFTSAQKELYEMVLDVQEKIISMIKPDIKRSSLHKKSEKLLTLGMVKLGILDGDVKKLLKEKKYKKYYPHGIGHHLGLDVHDEVLYNDENFKEIPLKEGMVLTIEPGIYCPKDDESIPKKYRGIGIRIEDNILVTKDGYENLSLEIVKKVKDIEKL